MLTLHVNLWPGDAPGPPQRHPARQKEAARHWSVPGSGSGSRTGGAAARAHRVPALVGDAEQPGVQPVGERVLRRLEAALEPPSRVGIAGLGATRGGGAGGAQTRTAPNPQQSLGLVGRSQPRPSERYSPGRQDCEGARPLRATASAVLPVRTSRAPGCASAPHVICGGVCGHDRGHRRCANHRERTPARARRASPSVRWTTERPGSCGPSNGALLHPLYRLDPRS